MDYTHRSPLHTGGSANSVSRISTVSDVAEFEPYGDDEYGGDLPLRGRPSLVSLPSIPSLRSQVDGASTPSGNSDRTNPASSPWSPGSGNLFDSSQPAWSSYNTGYTGSVGATGDYGSERGFQQTPLVPGRIPGGRTFSQRMSMRRRHHDIIPEEEDGMDLGLISAAAPLGSSALPDGAAVEPVFDVMSALGPSTLEDETFARKLREHEAQGILTGGLGQGIKADTMLTESALLASGSSVEQSRAPVSLSRTVSFAGRRPSLGRAATLKQLGQTQANKRGEVIEVIIEEQAQALVVGEDGKRNSIDLSAMTGPETLRHATFPSKPKTEVFYPQPDWKPFSMRWPYLLFLILVSIGLGGIQEIVYQMSVRKPLLSFHSPSEIPGGIYVAFKFLPTLITVTYGVLWQVTDFEVKRLEAFYQLSKEGGALAAESINVDYITNFNFFRPFQALYARHYAVFTCSVATILSNVVVPTLGAAAIYISPDRATRLSNPGDEKDILINPIWSRSLTAIFWLLAVLGCVLFYQLSSRKSGLLSDVQGIAGLASMAVISHILTDFRDMDVAAPSLIHHRLKDHRYVLRNASLAPDDDNPPSKQERDRYDGVNMLSQNPHPLMLRAAGAIPYMVFVALFVAVIPIVLFTPATVLADTAPWVLTILAVCVKLGWGALDTAVRMMEPYFILSRRHAPPRTLTLDYTAMPFGWAAWKAARNGHLLVALVCFGSVITEILTVLVTSLATVEGRDFIMMASMPPPPPPPTTQSGGSSSSTAPPSDIDAGPETAVSFWLTLALAMFILFYIMLVASAVFLRRRRVFLPRQPNTIASVLAFIHQSKMLYDFVGTAKLNTAQMVVKLEGLGKTYALGWFKGRDGNSHCGIDEEEILSGYKFGFDYSLATNPWEEGSRWL